MDALRRCAMRGGRHGRDRSGARSGLGRSRDMSEIFIKYYVGDICNATILNVYCSDVHACDLL